MYEIRTYPEAQVVIDALPAQARASYDDVVKVLVLVPENGEPYSKALPDGPMRTMLFGDTGFVTYLILADQQLVDVVQVTWVG